LITERYNHTKGSQKEQLVIHILLENTQFLYENKLLIETNDVYFSKNAPLK